MLKSLLRVYAAVHAVIALLFAAVALALIGIAAKSAWKAVAGGLDVDAAQALIDTIGLIAVAVVALQVSQTIAEEEVVREAHISAPTRVRRFLSRFMVVVVVALVVVALVVEGLVATMKALHQDMARLPYAAASLAGAAVLLAAWGVFVRLNAATEQLEPEAMDQAKEEDRKFD
jgi:hypothetical protein